MKFFYVEPEVAGSLGIGTVMNRATHPPVVSKLHYHLEGWLGDALLESFPSFVVTEEGRNRLQERGLTGVKFDEVEITTSVQFKESYPNRVLPKFVWLRPVGLAGQDDFGTAPDGRLIVSKSALETLERIGISNALVTPFNN